MVKPKPLAINLTQMFITVENGAVTAADLCRLRDNGAGNIMQLPAPFLADRGAVDDAQSLIREHGEEAGFAAAARAEQYRVLGNHLHFARWRQIERLITYLSIDVALDTVH